MLKMSLNRRKIINIHQIPIIRCNRITKLELMKEKCRRIAKVPKNSRQRKKLDI